MVCPWMLLGKQETTRFLRACFLFRKLNFMLEMSPESMCLGVLPCNRLPMFFFRGPGQHGTPASCSQ